MATAYAADEVAGLFSVAMDACLPYYGEPDFGLGQFRLEIAQLEGQISALRRLSGAGSSRVKTIAWKRRELADLRRRVHLLDRGQRPASVVFRLIIHAPTLADLDRAIIRTRSDPRVWDATLVPSTLFKPAFGRRVSPLPSPKVE